MDIAYYISDLLGQQGELTVPNLGYFVQIRMPAFYDSKARKFFPPHFSVQFDPQIIDDDDALANHITSLKKISVASAKYFIEKYISNLKSQAVVEDVPFSNLGTFSSDGMKLVFNTNTKTDDPAFFAYQPVDAARLGEAPIHRPSAPEPVIAPVVAPEPVQPVAAPIVETVAAPVVPEPAPTFLSSPDPVPVPAPTTYTPSQATDVPSDKPFFGSGSAGPVDFVTDDAEDEVYQEEPKTLGIWIIVAIAFTLLIIGLGVLYKFKPQLFKGLTKSTTSTVVTPPVSDPAKSVTPVDSTAIKAKSKQDSLKADSAAKKNTTAVKPATDAAVNKTPEVVKNDTKKPEATVPVKTETKPEVTAEKKPAEKDAAGDPVIPSGSWIIHSGSWVSKKPAIARVEELKKRGFEQAQLEKHQVASVANNYKVMLGFYKTRTEADNARKELLATGKIKADEISIDQKKAKTEE